MLQEPPRAPGRIIVFTVVVWDENCPRYIVRRFEEERVTALVCGLRRRIAELEGENARLLVALGDFPSTPA